MSTQTKIVLSAKELELVSDTDWILTKKIIINKVIGLFGSSLSIMQQFTAMHADGLPDEIFLKDPKIYKGENYKDLPYIMLDYPRYFDKEKTLSIRTFFWWGNFFSISLQLSGEIKQNAHLDLLHAFKNLQENNYWICVNDHPWEHNFDTENYVPVNKLSFVEYEAMVTGKLFVKISKKMPVQQWDGIALFIEQTFKNMILLLKTNYPTGEKDL